MDQQHRKIIPLAIVMALAVVWAVILAAILGSGIQKLFTIAAWVALGILLFFWFRLQLRFNRLMNSRYSNRPPIQGFSKVFAGLASIWGFDYRQITPEVLNDPDYKRFLRVHWLYVLALNIVGVYLIFFVRYSPNR